MVTADTVTTESANIIPGDIRDHPRSEHDHSTTNTLGFDRICPTMVRASTPEARGSKIQGKSTEILKQWRAASIAEDEERRPWIGLLKLSC